MSAAPPAIEVVDIVEPDDPLEYLDWTEAQLRAACERDGEDYDDMVKRTRRLMSDVVRRHKKRKASAS